MGACKKITGNGLAAGCQSFYRKIYGYFYSVVILILYISCAIDGRRGLLGSRAWTWALKVCVIVSDQTFSFWLVGKYTDWRTESIYQFS